MPSIGIPDASAIQGSSLFSPKRPSLFSKKSRVGLSTAASTVAEEEEQSAGATPNNGSSTSLSAAENASSPRRSLSLHSHKSQSSGSVSVQKTRQPSTSQPPAVPSVSPKRKHRLSGSITAAPTTTVPLPAANEYPQTHTSPSRTKEQVSSSATDHLRSGLHMLATSRRPSDQVGPGHSSYGSQLMGAASMSAPVQSGYSPAAIYNHVVETSNKRMATLDYLRKVHEGNIYYFSTISYNQAHLSGLHSLHPSRLGRRATNYLILGTSLSPLLELHANNPLDYLRALATLLTEFDTYSQLSSSDSGVSSLTRGRMGAMLKSGMRNVKSRRSSTAHDSIMTDNTSNGSNTNLSTTASIAESMPLPPISHSHHDFQYLQTPSLPFDPDFSTSFATLTDILIDAYMGLLNLVPAPDACVPGIAEAFAKADKGLKKVMISGIVNEFGDNVRKESRSEVGGLGKLVLGGLM